MIIAVTPIELVYRTETSMPALLPGEMALTSDTGRAVIGHDPKFGQRNYNRAIFPHQKIEMLTEISPRNWELFREFARDKDRHSYFTPTEIPVKVGPQPVPYSFYDGGFSHPLELDGDSFSAVIDYQVFQQDQLVKLGSLRILSSPSGTATVAEMTKIGDNTKVTFSVGPRKVVGSRQFYPVLCTNLTSKKLTLLVRKIVLDPKQPSFTPTLPPKPNYSRDLG